MSETGDFISRELAVANCREYEDEYFGTVVALPVFALLNLPSADVVTRDAYAQVVWERDTAIAQLKEIGKGLGEKMDDVVELKRDKHREYELKKDAITAWDRRANDV